MPINQMELRLVRTVEILQRKIERIEGLSRRISQLRGLIVLLGIVGYVVLSQGGYVQGSRLMILATIGVFIGAVVWHNRVIRGKKRHIQYQQIKRQHLARLTRDWQNIPQIQHSLPDSLHPFESDLDLFGPNSLHHLIDTAFSIEGSSLLHRWLTLLDPAVKEASRKQKLVRELIPLVGFRDRITLETAMISGPKGGPFKGNVLSDWLASHKVDGEIRLVLGVLFGLSALTIVLFVLKMTSVIESSWWAYSLATYVVVYLINFDKCKHLFDEAEHLHVEFEKVLPVFGVMESFRFATGSALEAVVSSLQNPNALPSTYARRVLWLSMAAGTQKNEVLRIVLNVIVPWELFFAFVLEKMKGRLSTLLLPWLEALQTVEAASSLATFASLNPTYSFPTWTDQSDEKALFEAAQLGHPLIPASSQVCNDFRICRVRDLALVTGSNMSGKSTFLRTVGINLALANAGGPVNASSMEIAPLRMFTCIRVADSVNDGISYFYAEVKRLKRMLTELESESEYPMIYFVDEVFRGTNNRERLIGSRELLRQLCMLNGVGLISTHDLELTSLADEMEGVTNFHFRETIENGKMSFDYLLHPGPSPTTNALTIMELEGLIPKRPSTGIVA